MSLYTDILAARANMSLLDQIMHGDGAATIDMGSGLLVPSVAHALASISWLPNVNDYGAVGDGVTDDSAAINSALSARGPGTIFLRPNKVYACLYPIIVPNGVQLFGFGPMQGSSALSALSGFPNTTVDGDQITPADPYTPFTFDVVSSANFTLGNDGVGVACVAGISIFFTAKNPTSLLNAWVGPGDTNKTLLDGREVSSYVGWLTEPGSGQGGFGTRMDNLALYCNNVPGISGLHSCHLQEGAGWSFLQIKNYKNFGFRAQQAYATDPSQGQCNDWDAHHYWMIASATMEAESIDIDIMQEWPTSGYHSPQQTYGVTCGSHVVQGSSAVGGIAMRVNGSIGTYGGGHCENKNTGYMFGDVSRCSLKLTSATMSNNWGAGALVELGNTTGNAAVIEQIVKADQAAVPGRKILIDHVNNKTFKCEQLNYELRSDSLYRVNGGILTGPAASRPSASLPENDGLDFLSNDVIPPKVSFCSGGRWISRDLDPGIYMKQDAIAAGARDNSSSTTLVVTFTEDTEIGDFLAVFAVSSSNAVISSIVDSAGNTWTPDVSVGTQGPGASIARCLVTTGHTHTAGSTLTITFSAANTYAAATVANFSGMITSSILDKTVTNNGSTGSGATGATATRTTADQLLLACVAYIDTAYHTAGDGWTALTSNVSGAGNRRITPLYKIVSDIGADSGTWNGNSTGFDAVQATYKALKAT